MNEVATHFFRVCNLHSIGALVQIYIDRPLGSRHPEHGFEYLVNYGYLPGELASDGEPLDAYVLGITAPLDSLSGRRIAVIHRLNEDDDKPIVVPDGMDYPDEDIRLATHFQESSSSRLFCEIATPN